jgi:hypothetical protein
VTTERDPTALHALQMQQGEEIMHALHATLKLNMAMLGFCQHMEVTIIVDHPGFPEGVVMCGDSTPERIVEIATIGVKRAAELKQATEAALHAANPPKGT